MQKRMISKSYNINLYLNNNFNNIKFFYKIIVLIKGTRKRVLLIFAFDFFINGNAKIDFFLIIWYTFSIKGEKIMEKEKFDRSKPHSNIGDIGTKDHGKFTTAVAFQHAQESYENYEKMVLQSLIDEYGEEEGKRRFEILKQESIKRYKDFQNIDCTPGEREEGVDFSIVSRKR